MGKRVVAAGHICIDITPVFQQQRPVSLGELLAPGKLLRMGPADVHTGGSVANTGLAMRLLGADARLMGKVGDDAFGGMVAEILRGYGAAEGLIVDPGSHTSYSVVLAPPGVDRVFLHHPGANDTFTDEDIPDAALREAALLHFGYPPLMRRMQEEGGARLMRLMRRAKALGCATSLDMAAVDPDSEAGRVDWAALLKNVLPYVDFFLPSVEELGFMLDRPLHGEWQRRAKGGDITGVLSVRRDVAPLAEKALALGAKIVVIKCGASGMYWRTGDAAALRQVGARAGLDAEAWADQGGFEHSYRPERICSGTGAGDTSIAAFLCAMLEGCPPAECIRLAAATGARCVESYDTLSSLLPFPALREKIAAGWEKQEWIGE